MQAKHLGCCLNSKQVAFEGKRLGLFESIDSSNFDFAEGKSFKSLAA